MKIQLFRVAAALSLIAVFGAAAARVGALQNQNSLLVITHANVIDGISNEPLRDVTVIVRAQIERGVNVIKIMATERAGLPDTDPRKRVFSDEEIAAIVDEARKSGIYVTAHAHGDEGAYAAVKAGVRSIERDPISDIKNLQDILLVINNGKPAVNRLNW
ncbi:MAG: amidohydrolase family protein [Acidobacteria bacterium]|nr:amidohydrolase family protein [Acidobacteriota bacterium]